LEQRYYLFTAEFILEKVTLIELYFLLRKKLFRFSAGVSFYPAIEVYLISHPSPPSES